ncbi:helix-turn-helix domain-containing protein [Pseudoclavibacter sp. CFCC 13796]|uniref:helix-turn-helix domain-containing protein n=1 Tax=Pseudoclavibacter sp. CFCC 13796 TaxID=2615179 RepID=UPI001CE44EF3|nr:helix-turn-helix domain-containing protein [Pseudoclavibacter sp. CFCC 13796]
MTSRATTPPPGRAPQTRMAPAPGGALPQIGAPAAAVRPDLAAIGDRIRSLRAERAMSLRALAEASGVGVASLSQLENGQRNPTLATLYALAGTLRAPLALLLDARAGSSVEGPGVSVRLLDTDVIGVDSSAQVTVEVYRLHLDSEASRRSPAHGPGVVEHVQVLAGLLRAGREGAEREASAGQNLEWVSDCPHTYRAVRGPVEAVLVITTPLV